MVAYAYLRVSSDHQDVDNQRHGILEYANTHRLSPLQFVEDTVFAEISRMARSTLQVLEMLECAMQREITVHIAKQQMILDSSMQSRITATVLGLAAEIEREFISLRTTEALAKRKAEGKSLGRPKGSQSQHLKLDEKETEIRDYLAKGISKRSIAKLVDCAPSTLYDWLKRRQIHSRPSSG